MSEQIVLMLKNEKERTEILKIAEENLNRLTKK